MRRIQYRRGGRNISSMLKMKESGRSSTHAAGASSTSLPTRWGNRVAKFAASQPPCDMPIRCSSGPKPSASNTSRSHALRSSAFFAARVWALRPRSITLSSA